MKFGGYARVSHKPVWSYCGHLNTTSAFFVMRSKLFGLGRTITSRCLDRTCLESWNFLVCHPKTLEIMYAQHVGSRIVHTEYPVPAFFSALLDPKFWDIFPGFSRIFPDVFPHFPAFPARWVRAAGGSIEERQNESDTLEVGVSEEKMMKTIHQKTCKP